MDSSTLVVNSSTTVGSDSLATAWSGPAGTWCTRSPGSTSTAGRQVGRPGPGEHVAGDPGPGQGGGELAHVDVHATPVARAWLGQRGRVQREDGEAAHGVGEPTGGPTFRTGAGSARTVREWSWTWDDVAEAVVGGSRGGAPACRSRPVRRKVRCPPGPGRCRSGAVGSDALAVGVSAGCRGLGLLVLELAAEGEVDADQRLLLLLADGLVGHDRPAQVGRAFGRVENAGLDVERLGGDAQRLGDLLEDLGRGAAQAALDLAEIRVRDAGELGEMAQRQSSGPPLLTDERPEIVPAVRWGPCSLDGVRAHSSKRTARRP